MTDAEADTLAAAWVQNLIDEAVRRGLLPPDRPAAFGAALRRIEGWLHRRGLESTAAAGPRAAGRAVDGRPRPGDN